MRREILWKVVPLSPGQLRDVREEDVLRGGNFRKCSTYRGGGGYDRFPFICEKRLGKRFSEQFVVQLFGCNLDCWYCYVTRQGVWGKYIECTTFDLISAFVESRQQVFHLMGGAPALSLQNWPLLIEELAIRCPDAVFHSDFLLTEKRYDGLLDAVVSSSALYAIDIKGVTKEEYSANTRKQFLKERMWHNLALLVQSRVNCYITFTAVSDEHHELFWSEFRKKFGKEKTKEFRDDSFRIDVIQYDAMPHVDEVLWGASKKR